MIGALINAGVGLFGQYQARKDAKDRRAYAEQQRELAYERSLPWSSRGPAGNVEFDPETREMLQTLNPEYQAMMQGFLGSSAMANQELQNMMGDPNKLAQEQFKMFEEFNADAFNRQRLQGQEAAIAQGRTGTQGYYDQMAIEDAIGRDRMRGQMQAIQTGMDYRNMLRAEALGMGEGARSVAGMLRPQAELGQTIGAGVDRRANMQGITDANKDYYQLKQNQTSGLMEQIQEYDLDDFYSMFDRKGSGGGMLSPSTQTDAYNAMGGTYAGKL